MPRLFDLSVSRSLGFSVLTFPWFLRLFISRPLGFSLSFLLISRLLHAAFYRFADIFFGCCGFLFCFSVPRFLSFLISHCFNFAIPSSIDFSLSRSFNFSIYRSVRASIFRVFHLSVPRFLTRSFSQFREPWIPEFLIMKFFIPVLLGLSVFWFLEPFSRLISRELISRSMIIPLLQTLALSVCLSFKFLVFCSLSISVSRSLDVLVSRSHLLCPPSLDSLVSRSFQFLIC